MTDRVQKAGRHLATWTLLTLCMLAFGCQDAPNRKVEVLAAASMADVLPEIAREFEARHGIEVELSFDSTSRVARQIESGAPADVFVSANVQWVDYLDEQNALKPSTRRVFAGNRLVWIEPAERPSGAKSLADAVKRKPDRLALADRAVPAGAYAEQALRHEGYFAGLQPTVVRAPHVRAVVEWVARGEADAGICYRTDAIGRETIRTGFELPLESHDTIQYEAVVTSEATHGHAHSFVRFLVSDYGQRVLQDHGFEPPPAIDATSTNMTEHDVDIWSPIRISLLVGLLAALFGVLPAIGLGWLLARRDFRGKSLLSTLVLAPLAMPPVVTGFLLLEIFGRRGLIGGWLNEVGLEFTFSRLGAILAAFTVGLPLFVMAARNSFEQVDPVLEDVARSLGDSRWSAFRRVTLPLAWPGIAAGAMLMFARAVGEFGATAVLAGNIEGETRTLALAVYTLLETPGGQNELWWLVGGAIGLSFAAVLGYEWLNRWQKQRCGVRYD